MALPIPAVSRRGQLSERSITISTTTSTDLEVQNAAADAALLQQQDSEFDNDTLSAPILKIGQPLTREVIAEEAESGEFINTLTGEGLGDKLSFIVSYYQKGRFAADRDSGRAFVAFGDTIPEAWGDLVGEEFVGTPFAEYPDAEERFKERVNAKEIEWGKGPLVSTTHNYTGLVIVEPLADDEDGEVEYQPVRLSLQRTNMPAVRKINSIKRMTLRNKMFWDIVFDLGTFRKQFNQGSAFLLSVAPGRKTTDEEKASARELALAVLAGRVAEAGARDGAASETAPAAEPDAKGGVAL